MLKQSRVFIFVRAADRLRDTRVDRCYRSWCILCSVWLNNQMMCALDPIQRENDLRKIGSRQLTFLTCVVYEREHGETCTAAQVCCLDGHSIVMCDHSMQWGAVCVCGLCVVLVICTSQKALIAVWSLTCVIIQNVKVLKKHCTVKKKNYKIKTFANLRLRRPALSDLSFLNFLSTFFYSVINSFTTGFFF